MKNLHSARLILTPNSNFDAKIDALAADPRKEIENRVEEWVIQYPKTLRLAGGQKRIVAKPYDKERVLVQIIIKNTMTCCFVCTK